jgi:ectoine hydroxylase-related dioxygenase (phytanoyl-CoA dioxygenase family)
VDVAAAAARFSEVGYVEVRGLFTAPEAADLLAAVQAAQPRVPDPNELSVDGMEFASNLFYRSAALQELVASPRIVPLLQAILGSDVWCRWDQAVNKGPGAGWFPWHQDNGYTRLAAEHVQVWVALTPSSASNGGLQLAPGRHHGAADHHWVGTQVELDVLPEDTVAIDAAPGDVVFFSSFLPHATTPNRTDQERWAYVAEYLAVSDPDPAVPPPHFVVSRAEGRPASFQDLTPSWMGTST